MSNGATTVHLTPEGIQPIPADTTLQEAYDAAVAPPQIVINATPDPLTIDASVAGDIFAVRDVADGDLIRMSTTGSSIAGGSNAGNLLTLQGSLAANRGRNIAAGGITIDWDWATDAVAAGGLYFNNTVPSSGGYIGANITIANTITVDNGLFILSAVDDLSTLTWTVAPGFAVETLFFARPTYRSTTPGVSPAQAFTLASQNQYRLTGAGNVSNAGYRCISHSPIIRVDNAGDQMHFGATTGLILSPLFNTRNATAIADFGTIRGVWMNNAAAVAFGGQGLGSEIATNWIGLDVEALTGLTVSGVRAAVRSAIPISGIANFCILNNSNAPSSFGTGRIWVADNTGVNFGNTILAPDVITFWSSGASAYTIQFATTNDNIQWSSPAADRFLMNFNADAELNINARDGFSMGAQTGSNGNQFGNFVTANLTPPIGGDYTGFLLTHSENYVNNGAARGRVSAWVINGFSYANSTGSVAEADTLTVGGFVTSAPGVTITERQSLNVIGGRSKMSSVMQYEPINPAVLGSGNNNNWAGLLTGSANNNMRHWARITSNADGTSIITGIDATAVQDGDTWKITNVGAFNASFGDQDAASTAANRIITGTGVTYIIGPDETCEVTYDLTTARWRILYGSGA